MTLHATCPTNGTKIDFGFPVYAAEAEPEARERMPRGGAHAVRLASGDIRVDVPECPACGRVHSFVTSEARP